MFRRVFFYIYFIIYLFISNLSIAQETARLYLSGKGNEDAIDWDFYCTEGRNSNVWTKIPVPSCWELHGFGTYNYGHDKIEDRGKEQGFYKRSFTIPKELNKKVVFIVFEGSMTDTEVWINGKLAGQKHKGAFYKFQYDITKLVKFNTENLLEVKVSKHSEDVSVNQAERFADYWIFGGIFRPVYLEFKPDQNIERIAIDAQVSGVFMANVYLKNIRSANKISAQIFDLHGNTIGGSFQNNIEKKASLVNITGKITGVSPWTPEFPNLYYIQLSLMDGENIIHVYKERFGFRTVEVKERDGIYVNGEKIKFKGVCRHSFWPKSGRTLSKQMSIDDVLLMKEMNMNAVRMSHYPPDSHFLDVCDSLGLFVLDELAGWQSAYNTDIGKKLVKEMVVRDVNHPSIVLWDNGNEGGWNTDLDDDFALYDPQKREVIHPWENFRKTDTNHYIDYNYGTNDSFNGSKIFFPTEFLHGLYDGGHGAGLEDYWDLMYNKSLSAGGFLWVFSDESVYRTDKGGFLDSDGNHAPDGILGPYREKEASFYTIKELWAPVKFDEKYITNDFDGILRIENRYHYTNLQQCIFQYEFVKFTVPMDKKVGYHIISQGQILSPDIHPGERGYLQIDLPIEWYNADALYVKVIDPHGKEIYTWDWPISLPETLVHEILDINSSAATTGSENEELVIMEADNIIIQIESKTGLIKYISKNGATIPLSGGPILSEGESTFIKQITFQKGNDFIYEADFSGNLKKIRWTLLGNGLLKLNVVYVPNNNQPFYGINFNYPEEKVKSVKWLGKGPYRIWKNRLKGVKLNVWEKAYNNAITGESYIYPEFKGYHANMYWMQLTSVDNSLSVYTTNENLFMRLFTPGLPESDPRNTEVDFPDGDISFLHGINAIGTKFKDTKNLGPQSQLNMYKRHHTDRDLSIELYFDFR